ncbi:hypothetical protein XENOCAPTIV_001764 [Xenoophorus captivus]|uniref:Uncharacterized protein n=1 Tax=Xenoophorus captivus TaxID=1517983 RepID=A0ABV0QQJ2_9TELE
MKKRFLNLWLIKPSCLKKTRGSLSPCQICLWMQLSSLPGAHLLSSPKQLLNPLVTSWSDQPLQYSPGNSHPSHTGLLCLNYFPQLPCLSSNPSEDGFKQYQLPATSPPLNSASLASKLPLTFHYFLSSSN